MSLIPHPIPSAYRETLRRLGTEAVVRFNHLKYDNSNQALAQYEEAARLLELFEKQLRRQLGVN
jgi:hypothetical protein